MTVPVPPIVKDLKDEHVLMAGAYSGGAMLSHSVVANIIVGAGYMAVAVIGIRENRKARAARED
jgi:hypothetical protein